MKLIKRITGYLRYNVGRIKDNLIYWLHVKYYDDFCIKIINGCQMLIPVNDTGIGKDLICNPIREKCATEYLNKVINEDDVVVDIGANIGYYALLCAQKVKRVYAIEPVGNTCWYLEASIRLNGYDNIDVYGQLAIGDKNCVSNFYVSPKCNWSGIAYNNRMGDTKKIRVFVKTLDAFMFGKTESATIVRMDVEGYEYEIIKGMNTTLRTLEYLFIEVHPHLIPEDRMVEMLTKIKNAGFEIDMIAKRDVRYSCIISDLLVNNDFLNGSLGAFQVIFKRVTLGGKL